MSTTESAYLDAVHARYLAERDKRLRPEGNDQYREVTGQFARYADDPYVEPVERPPLFDEVTVAFIGGGFAGLVTGAMLKQAGIRSTPTGSPRSNRAGRRNGWSTSRRCKRVGSPTKTS